MTNQASNAMYIGTSTLSPELTARARALLTRQRTRKVPETTRLCAVVASLPSCVKVQDVAPLYGLTATTLSKLRGQAFRRRFAFPEALRAELERSFTPRKAD